MHGYTGIQFLCFAFPAFLVLLGLNSHCIISLCIYFATDKGHSTVIEMSGSVFLLALPFTQFNFFHMVTVP